MKPMEHDVIVQLVKYLEQACSDGQSDAFNGDRPSDTYLYSMTKDHRDCYLIGYRRGMAEWEQARGERHPHRGAI